jgi:hypothetical protein
MKRVPFESTLRRIFRINFTALSAPSVSEASSSAGKQDSSFSYFWSEASVKTKLASSSKPSNSSDRSTKMTILVRFGKKNKKKKTHTKKREMAYWSWISEIEWYSLAEANRATQTPRRIVSEVWSDNRQKRKNILRL